MITFYLKLGFYINFYGEEKLKTYLNWVSRKFLRGSKIKVLFKLGFM